MTWSQFIHWIPALTGFFALAIGVIAFIRPAPSSKSFGIEVTDRKSLNYVAATGARDIFIGLITLVLYQHGDTKVIGANFLCISVVAFCDFSLTFKNGSRRHSAIHLAGAVFSLAYGWMLVLTQAP